MAPSGAFVRGAVFGVLATLIASALLAIASGRGAALVQHVTRAQQEARPLVSLSHGGGVSGETAVRKRIVLEAVAGSRWTGLSHSVLAPGSRVERHAHASKDEVFLVRRAGRSWMLQIWDQAQAQPRTVALAAGDAVLVPAGVEHAFVRDAAAEAGEPGDVLELEYFGVFV